MIRKKSVVLAKPQIGILKKRSKKSLSLNILIPRKRRKSSAVKLRLRSKFKPAKNSQRPYAKNAVSPTAPSIIQNKDASFKQLPNPDSTSAELMEQTQMEQGESGDPVQEQGQFRPTWYVVVVGYVNRPDILYQALGSIQSFWPSTLVIDNANEASLIKNAVELPVKVYQPPDPLSYSQTLNLMHRIAAENGAEVCIFMHHDAELQPEMADRLLSALEDLRRSDRRWGAFRTESTSLTAYNMKAIRTIGPMDTILPHDFAEQDYYRRMNLLGFDIVEDATISVAHWSDVSSTYKSDEELDFVRNKTRPFYLNYYQDKWGGPPGSETHELLFGEFPLNPVPNYLYRFQ
ncbi:glycosyltransferase family 2 protein [Paenibacillus sp. GCM10027628]|uniref:glycosyltransferase family 2 protein n=1 Tax=Paenibacillus sp. GCM10027628 TaxID=3273413 RepID=UPI003632DBAF